MLNNKEELFISENENEILEKWEEVYFQDVIEFFVKGQLIKIVDHKIFVFFENEFEPTSTESNLETLFNVERDSRKEYLAKLQAMALVNKMKYDFPFKKLNTSNDEEILNFIENSNESEILLESGITIKLRKVPASALDSDKEFSKSIILDNCKDYIINEERGLNVIAHIMDEFNLTHMDAKIFNKFVKKEVKEKNYSFFTFENNFRKCNLQLVYNGKDIERFYNTKSFSDIINSEDLSFIFSYHLTKEMKIDARTESLSCSQILIVEIEDCEILEIIKNAGGIKSLNEKNMIMSKVFNNDSNINKKRRRM